jgi:hypothetical protein
VRLKGGGSDGGLPGVRTTNTIQYRKSVSTILKKIIRSTCVGEATGGLVLATRGREAFNVGPCA